MKIVKILLLLLIFNLLKIGKSFSQDYPYDITQYNFVNYNQNKLIFSNDSTKFEKIFQKIDSMINYGKGNLNVVQLGASHTQADIFSGRMRYRLQTFHPGMIGSRGFIFPYKMTKSNNPSNYSISYTGFWTTCRNIEWKRACQLGLAGISATTYDANATLSIKMNPSNVVKYDFNIVKIITRPYSEEFYDIVPEVNCGGYTVKRIDSLGLTEFKFEKYLKSVSFHLEKTIDTQKEFTLYGISLENDNPSGVTYSAIGVNGASIKSWLACEHFASQLKLLNPDWIVVFLGVNDGNTSNFSQENFYSNYVMLLDRIKNNCPNVNFTFIVPNDFYLFRKRPNPAVAKEEEAIKQLTTKYNASMWSLYDMMGGFGSSLTWVNKGLMAGDKVHLTATGYNFSADMFFNAFLRAYDNYLEKKLKKNQ